jgi:hypothetical protein
MSFLAEELRVADELIVIGDASLGNARRSWLRALRSLDSAPWQIDGGAGR